jgi:hypothetical protein
VARYLLPACRAGFIRAATATRAISSFEGGALRLLPYIQGKAPRCAASPMVAKWASAKKPGLMMYARLRRHGEQPIDQPALAGHQRRMRGTRQPLRHADDVFESGFFRGDRDLGPCAFSGALHHLSGAP